MSRRTVASDRRPSHKSSSWVRRSVALQEPFSSLAPHRLLAQQPKPFPVEFALPEIEEGQLHPQGFHKRGHNNFRTQLETLEERRLLTVSVAVVDNGSSTEDDNSGIVRSDERIHEVHRV